MVPHYAWSYYIHLILGSDYDTFFIMVSFLKRTQLLTPSLYSEALSVSEVGRVIALKPLLGIWIQLSFLSKDRMRDVKFPEAWTTWIMRRQICRLYGLCLSSESWFRRDKGTQVFFIEFLLLGFKGLKKKTQSRDQVFFF